MARLHKNIYNEEWLNIPLLFIQENIKINTPKYYKLFIYKNEHSPKILKSGLKKKPKKYSLPIPTFKPWMTQEDRINLLMHFLQCS